MEFKKRIGNNRKTYKKNKRERKKIIYKIIWYDREFFATNLKLMKVWADNKFVVCELLIMLKAGQDNS